MENDFQKKVVVKLNDKDALGMDQLFRKISVGKKILLSNIERSIFNLLRAILREDTVNHHRSITS